MLTVYSASWCEPCKTLKQLLDIHNIEYKNIDIDKEPEVARKAGIRGIPTIVTSTGETKVGVLTLKQIQELNPKDL